jgi:cytochrome c peroxidase
MKKKFATPKTFAALLFFICAVTILLIPQSCTKEPNPLVTNNVPGTPVLPAQPYDYTNGGQNDLVTLGRVLFYDRNLSLNNQVSCGSCHKQKNAFADNQKFSRGLFNGYTSRNSSAILGNSSMFSSQRNRFWDGRAASSSIAVFMPVANNVEMHVFDLNLLPAKLSKIEYYQPLFTNAYGSSEVNIERIRGALAAFVDALISYGSPYDLQTMNALQHEGLALFEGKARCYSCHNGNDFNGYQPDYENIGLEVNYADNGRGKITMREEDNGSFLVPTLRNIEYSAPYMHDGRYNTLREVIDHYDHGVQDSRNLSWALRDISQAAMDTMNFQGPVPNSTFAVFPVIRMGLSEHEKLALEAFLKSLSDPAFVTDPKYSDPFK